MLTTARMGGMDTMGVFYDSCLETLYPPGTCGSLCNEHTFECYLAEVQEACCDEGGRNCVSGQDVPDSCPIGCAIVFPQFLEVCTDHLAGTGAVMADFEAFETQCLDTDGQQLVEYAIMLLERGCAIDLPAASGTNGAGDSHSGGGGGGGHRRMMLLLQRRRRRRHLQQQPGYMAPHLSSQANQCTWDRIDDFAKEVDAVCCGANNAGCSDGTPPAACSAGCAVTIRAHAFLFVPVPSSIPWDFVAVRFTEISPAALLPLGLLTTNE